MQTKLYAVLAFCLFPGIAIAGAPPAPPETDAHKFVRLTRVLEENPLQDTTKEMRTWLLAWATKSPDVSVSICDILGPIPKRDVPYGGELLMQSMFGNAAFQIEHPDQKGDELADQLAGVRSLLKAYAVIIVDRPQTHIEYFDLLLKKANDDTLTKFMAPLVAEKCSGSSAP